MNEINLNDNALLNFLKKHKIKEKGVASVMETIKKSKTFIFFHPNEWTVRRSLGRLNEQKKITWTKEPGKPGGGKISVIN